jgi:hypothetical protein
LEIILGPSAHTVNILVWNYFITGLKLLWGFSVQKFVLCQYVIGDNDLERVDVINDLWVLVDSRMTFVNHIESILSKSARVLGFIKWISREFNGVAFVRPGLEYVSCVWSPHQEVYLSRIEGIQHNFIRFALQGLGWTTQPLPPYDSRCLLLVLKVLSDRRKIAAALFVRDYLYRRIVSSFLADLLRFESNPYPRRRNVILMDFYHRTNCSQNELINKAIFDF